MGTIQVLDTLKRVKTKLGQYIKSILQYESTLQIEEIEQLKKQMETESHYTWMIGLLFSSTIELLLFKKNQKEINEQDNDILEYLLECQTIDDVKEMINQNIDLFIYLCSGYYILQDRMSHLGKTAVYNVNESKNQYLFQVTSVHMLEVLYYQKRPYTSHVLIEEYQENLDRACAMGVPLKEARKQILSYFTKDMLAFLYSREENIIPFLEQVLQIHLKYATYFQNKKSQMLNENLTLLLEEKQFSLIDYLRKNPKALNYFLSEFTEYTCHTDISYQEIIKTKKH